MSVIRAGISNTLLNNLVAYWKLDEASGSRADSKGSHTLSDINTVTQAAGKHGNAAQFTAANLERLNLADDANFRINTNALTIAGWFYLDSLNENRAIIAKRAEWVLYVDGANKPTFNFPGDGTIQTPTAVSSGQWYFVVGWWKNENNAGRGALYIQVNNGTIYNTGLVNGFANWDTDVNIGAWEEGVNSYTFFWNGRLDSIGVWRRELTAEERALLYNGGNGRNYPF